MKKVNWKQIGTVIGAIGWLATALYAWYNRYYAKYWKETWEKEMNRKVDYWVLLTHFTRHWRCYKNATNEHDKEYYANSLTDDTEKYDRYQSGEK